MGGELTECQRGILAAIRKWTAENKCPPTLRELAGEIGWTSWGSVGHELRQLRRGGWVTWEPRRARTLKVI